VRETTSKRSVEIEAELKSVEDRIGARDLGIYRDHLLREALRDSVAVANRELEDFPEESLEAMRVRFFGK